MAGGDTGRKLRDMEGGCGVATHSGVEAIGPGTKVWKREGTACSQNAIMGGI